MVFEECFGIFGKVSWNLIRKISVWLLVALWALKLRVLWQYATVVGDINTRVGTFCLTDVLIVKLKSLVEIVFRKYHGKMDVLHMLLFYGVYNYHASFLLADFLDLSV